MSFLAQYSKTYREQHGIADEPKEEASGADTGTRTGPDETSASDDHAARQSPIHDRGAEADSPPGASFPSPVRKTPAPETGELPENPTCWPESLRDMLEERIAVLISENGSNLTTARSAATTDLRRWWAAFLARTN